LLERLSARVEARHLARAVVAHPDPSAAVDGEPPDAGVRRRGRKLRHLPRAHVHPIELVPLELREIDGHFLPRSDDAVGVGARRLDVVLRDPSDREIETPDAVPGLLGEPDHPVRALDRRVRARPVVWGALFGVGMAYSTMDGLAVSPMATLQSVVAMRITDSLFETSDVRRQTSDNTHF